MTMERSSASVGRTSHLLCIYISNITFCFHRWLLCLHFIPFFTNFLKVQAVLRRVGSAHDVSTTSKAGWKVSFMKTSSRLFSQLVLDVPSLATLYDTMEENQELQMPLLSVLFSLEYALRMLMFSAYFGNDFSWEYTKEYGSMNVLTFAFPFIQWWTPGWFPAWGYYE